MTRQTEQITIPRTLKTIRSLTCLILTLNWVRVDRTRQVLRNRRSHRLLRPLRPRFTILMKQPHSFVSWNFPCSRSKQ